MKSPAPQDDGALHLLVMACSSQRRKLYSAGYEMILWFKIVCEVRAAFLSADTQDHLHPNVLYDPLHSQVL